MNSKQLWIWLTVCFGPANKRKWEVLSGYESIDEFYRSFMRGNVLNLTADEKKRMKNTDADKIIQIENYCNAKGINIYCYDDDEFPQRLREIFNPPSILFVKGDILSLDSEVLVTVAGARELSDYSRSVEENIVHGLCDAGIQIVSGVQIGADQEASLAAIEHGAKSYAVLGFGMEYEYPKGSTELLDKIAQNGAVISEYFPNHKPRTKDFHFRNRILAALSLGVLIVQASASSGSLSIAEFALNQGKDIFVIPPHDINDNAYKGNIRLFRDGAIPVFSELDILNEYKNNYSHRLNFSASYEREFEPPATTKISNKKQTNKANKTDPDSVVKTVKETQTDLSGVSDVGIKILDVLKSGVSTADELADKLSVDVLDLALELTELEISGIIKALPGRRYSL